jgi:hypothetical protein
MARVFTSNTQVEGGTVRQKLTLTVENEYVPTNKWFKMYQNKELLDGLSPIASKLLIHIGLNLEYGAQKVRLAQSTSGMGNRAYPKAINELITKRIVVKEKREWYWVNITLLVMGQIARPLPLTNKPT